MKWKCWLGKMCMCNKKTSLVCTNRIKETSKTKTMIHFNDYRLAPERAATQPLTLKEEERAIELINELITGNEYKLSADNEDVIQRFVWHYENMSHAITTNGIEV